MTKILNDMWKLFFVASIVFNWGVNCQAHAQANEIAQLILNFEKLQQFKQILEQMKQGYEILNGGYTTVKNIAEGNFRIHKDFLDGLLEVNPAVKNYRRVADIIRYQKMLITEYKSSLSRFRRDPNFTADELAYIGNIYSGLFQQSLRNLDELTNVITSGKMRMSDDERIKLIDEIFLDMQDKLMFLRYFNGNTAILAVQRAKERNDVSTLKGIYGIQ